MAWNRSPDVKGLAWKERKEEREGARARMNGRQTRARQQRRNAFGDLEFRVDYSGAEA